jgi:hypothetical protein
VNGLEHAMAKAWHGGIGEAWMGFGHVSDEARRRAGHSASRGSTTGTWRCCGCRSAARTSSDDGVGEWEREGAWGGRELGRGGRTPWMLV